MPSMWMCPAGSGTSRKYFAPAPNAGLPKRPQALRRGAVAERGHEGVVADHRHAAPFEVAGRFDGGQDWDAETAERPRHHLLIPLPSFLPRAHQHRAGRRTTARSRV